MKTAKLFLDLDGVLADFDHGVERVTGKRPEKLKVSDMWRALAREPQFFDTLELMHDAELLWLFCKPFHPTILTDCRSAAGRRTRSAAGWRGCWAATFR